MFEYSNSEFVTFITLGDYCKFNISEIQAITIQKDVPHVGSVAIAVYLKGVNSPILVGFYNSLKEAQKVIKEGLNNE